MRVVCINDEWQCVTGLGMKTTPDAVTPKLNQVYVVAGKEKLADLCFYQLEGFPEFSFWGAWHFRPVTDITELEKLLVIEPVRETV